MGFLRNELLIKLEHTNSPSLFGFSMLNRKLNHRRRELKRTIFSSVKWSLTGCFEGQMRHQMWMVKVPDRADLLLVAGSLFLGGGAASPPF